MGPGGVSVLAATGGVADDAAGGATGGGDAAGSAGCTHGRPAFWLKDWRGGAFGALGHSPHTMKPRTATLTLPARASRAGGDI